MIVARAGASVIGVEGGRERLCRLRRRVAGVQDIGSHNGGWMACAGHPSTEDGRRIHMMNDEDDKDTGNSSSHASALDCQTCAEEWRAQGGVAAAVQSIQSRDPEKALHATKAVAELVQAGDADAFLAEDGAVRALLHEIAQARIEMTKIKLAALRDVAESVSAWASKHAPTKVVDAFTDSDPGVAAVALHSCSNLFEEDNLAESMVEAGAADALVAGLSHQSPYVRSAAAICATRAARNPTMCSALLAAGLVSTLLSALRTADDSSDICPPCLWAWVNTACISEIKPSDADYFAYVALLCIIVGRPSTAVHVFEDPGRVKLVHGLREDNVQKQYASARVLKALFDQGATLKESTPELARDLCEFCNEFVAEGVPARIPRLIRPAEPMLAILLLDVIIYVIDGLDDGAFPR